MRYKEIVINGQKMPVGFGLFMLSKFEDETGISISELGEGRIALKEALILAHLALQDGARRAGTSYEASLEDTCDMFDEDQDALERVLTAFSESMPQEDGEEKKVKPRPGKGPKK